MDLSVIILNWNAREWLERSVGSALEQNTGGRPFEVLLVDNASRDDSVDFVRERFPAARVVALPENLGFAGGNNAAIPMCQGNNILLLNPDTISHPGAFAAILDFLEAHPKCGIVGPKLLNQDGSLQYSCRHFPSLEAAIFRNTPIGRFFSGNKATRDYLMKDVSHDSAMQVDWVSGAALTVRREVLDSIGLLDERFFMFEEDVDLCYRARQAGWEVWYEPAGVITHAIGQSTNKTPFRMIIAFHKAMYRFYKKHYIGSRYPRWMTPVVWGGVVTRAALVMAVGVFHRLMGRKG